MTQLFSIFIMFSGARETAVITGHGIWSHDGHVFMQDISHLKLIVMGLLQTCSYITEQMQMPVKIDVNKFMESFSIKANGCDISPPFWIAEEDNSVTLSQATSVISDFQLGSSPKIFTMEDYSRCRQAEAIRWINLQENRASIIARFRPVTAEEYQRRRDAINSESGLLSRKGI